MTALVIVFSFANSCLALASICIDRLEDGIGCLRIVAVHCLNAVNLFANESLVAKHDAFSIDDDRVFDTVTDACVRSRLLAGIAGLRNGKIDDTADYEEKNDDYNDNVCPFLVPGGGFFLWR